MGYCFISADEDGKNFAKCNSRFNASEHPELPCGGMGGGVDDMTVSCSAFANTKTEAKELLKDWENNIGVE